MVYPDHLPNTSVIIIFHNEAWCTLTRTIWSIIQRTPRQLLAEIILVDDHSDLPHLAEPLDAYVARLPVRCVVVRQTPRSGLIQARLLGAATARGSTLTFFDSHCECTVGWLQPLLAGIARNRHAVAIPTIDIISEDTFAYAGATIDNWGGFSDAFIFKW